MSASSSYWSPATLGEVIQGSRPVWNAKPASLTELDLPSGNGWVAGGNTPVTNIGGATYDPVGKRLYLLGHARGADVYTCRLYVFDVDLGS